ncbi:MFS transporter [Glycomyces harbinensis]|uniref:MFS transporter n=1 Tax=Glycomyces harbinensis TaxID=58114 RepID=UPI00115F848D|nr:MFS transporter [Glycomyces harbinensis]
MSQTPFRLLRAAVFAAVSVSASLLLHLWSGGHAPGPLQLSGAFALVLAAAYAIGGRQRGFLLLAPLCLAAQWGLHECFELGAVAAPSHAHGAGLSMWLVHLAAALAQASWLARGESALAAMLELLTLFFARAVRVLGLGAPVAVRPLRVAFRSAVPRLRPAERSAVSRRGPPRFAF